MLSTVKIKLRPEVEEELRLYVKDWKKERFKMQFKKEATSAGYRVAATQTVKLAQGAAVAGLKKAGHSVAAADMAAMMLDTEFGKALLSLSLGVGATYLPTTDARVVRLGKELRIGGMTTVGNEIVGSVVSAVLEALQEVPAEALAPVEIFVPAEEQSEVKLKSA